MVGLCALLVVVVGHLGRLEAAGEERFDHPSVPDPASSPVCPENGLQFVQAATRAAFCHRGCVARAIKRGVGESVQLDEQTCCGVAYAAGLQKINIDPAQQETRGKVSTLNEFCLWILSKAAQHYNDCTSGQWYRLWWHHVASSCTGKKL